MDQLIRRVRVSEVGTVVPLVQALTVYVKAPQECHLRTNSVPCALAVTVTAQAD